jgi:hypothetical protein
MEPVTGSESALESEVATSVALAVALPVLAELDAVGDVDVGAGTEVDPLPSASVSSPTFGFGAVHPSSTTAHDHPCRTVIASQIGAPPARV